MMSQSRRQRLRARKRARTPEQRPNDRHCGSCCGWIGSTNWHLDGHREYGEARVCLRLASFLCGTVRNALDCCEAHRRRDERPLPGPRQLLREGERLPQRVTPRGMEYREAWRTA